MLKEGKTYYILNISDKAILNNEFRYIKELLLQYHNYAMFEVYEAMKSRNVRVYSVKSDVSTFHPHDMRLIRGREIRHHRKMVSFFNVDPEEFTLVDGIWYCKNVEGILNVSTEISPWKIENKIVKLLCDVYKFKYNEVPEIPKMENKTLQIEDEWDTHSICKQILEKVAMMICDFVPGTGKSFIGEYFIQMNKCVLFKISTNKLLQEKEVDAVTYNKFFSISMGVGGGLSPFDDSCYGIAAFDEIFMVNMNIWNRMMLFCLRNIDKIRIATGDTKQLQPINRLGSPDKEMNHCVGLIFKYKIS